MAGIRKIIHCDCDCFYASIETRDNPGLAGLPVAVGGSPRRRGVIATCNYEARRFGIHSAMASATARRLCPELIIIKPQMEKYREASSAIHEIFHRFTTIIEPLSLDEAFLDVSDCKVFDGDAVLIASNIRHSIETEVGITVSAGIAPNKFLAKIASDWQKPNGQFAIADTDIDNFVKQLPVSRIFGVGKVTASRLAALGIEHCGQLAKLSAIDLTKHFGSFGERLYDLCRGIDNRPVQVRRIRKSISVEHTFAQDLQGIEDCKNRIPNLLDELRLRMSKIESDYCISRQFVKIKFHDFVTTTVETVSQNLNSEVFARLVEQGFRRGNRPVRLVGIGAGLEPRTATGSCSVAGEVASKTPFPQEESQIILKLE